MHARHRSPGNGYRSNSMGMAVTASRSSPEGSMRSHGMYNSEYRNFNRGFGRSLPKPYHPPQLQLPRKGDIFVEAGRLAAEYLVSKGVLPPSALPSKWQNGSFKKQVADFQEFRPQEGENLQLPQEGRTSALARLGNTVHESSPGRKRFPDDYDQIGSRTRGKRRPIRNYGSEWGRENERIGLWSDKGRTGSQDMEVDGDFVSENQEEQRGGKDGSWVHSLHPSEPAPKTDDPDSSVYESAKYQPTGDMGSKASSSSSMKDPPLDADGELAKEFDSLKCLNSEIEEGKDGVSTDGMRKQIANEGFPIEHGKGDCDPVSNNGTNLLSLCNFAKVPTRTRSSLTSRGSKAELVPVSEEGNTSDTVPPGGSGGIPFEEDTVDGSSIDALTNQNQSPNCLDPDVSEAPAVQSARVAGELSPAYAVEQGKCMRSQSFSDRAFMYEQVSSQGPPGFGRCNSMGSMVKERGEKRALQHTDMGDGSKKLKEWLPSIVNEADNCFHLSNVGEKQPSSQEERTSPSEDVIVALDHESPVDFSLFPKVKDESCIEYAEERQLLPGSFKICDLNLMEASDMNENHAGDSVLIYPSISDIKKEATSVDIDLSMSNNCNTSKEYGRRSADGKEVEVIDLENDSAEEDKAPSSPERETETVVCTELESFPNHTQNGSDICIVQDSNGLLMNDFLETGISNCSLAPAEVNLTHNEMMGLHNREEILDDDDPIYMSLGEIPISMPDL